MEEVNVKRKEVNEAELFDDKNVPEVSSFFKFKKIGDRVSGYLKIQSYEEPGKDDFRAQKVYTLENCQITKIDDNGREVKEKIDEIKVGISVDKKLTVAKAEKAKVGEPLGFKYKEDYQTPENKKKGKHPFKVIEVYTK